jgi:hypothetical protein
MINEIAHKGTEQSSSTPLKPKKIFQYLSGMLLTLSLCSSIVAYFCFTHGFLGELQVAISSTRITYGWMSIIKMFLVALSAMFFPTRLLRSSNSQQISSAADYLSTNTKCVVKRVGIIFLATQMALPMDIYLLKQAARVIVLEQLIVLLAILAFVALGVFVPVRSKTSLRILSISVIFFLVVGIPMLLISVLGITLSLGPERMTRAVILYLVYTIASLSPVTTAFFPTEMIAPGIQLWGTWMYAVVPGVPSFPVLSPWIPYTVIYLGFALFLFKKSREFHNQ